MRMWLEGEVTGVAGRMWPARITSGAQPRSHLAWGSLGGQAGRRALEARTAPLSTAGVPSARGVDRRVGRPGMGNALAWEPLRVVEGW